jgi:hypothetical protein
LGNYTTYVLCILKIFSLLAWLSTSLILTLHEQNYLSEITHSSNGTLLYRATRDGFTTEAFHEKCDGKADTVTIIKTDLDYVFGGFASAIWTSVTGFISDSKAFIFSVRRKGITNSIKFKVKNAIKALYGGSEYGPTFGDYDIIMKNRSDYNTNSYSKICDQYECLSYNLVTYDRLFLAGVEFFKTTEIEVYQITHFH